MPAFPACLPQCALSCSCFLSVLFFCPAQAIPGLSPVPWWGTLFPLAVVLLVNAVKEAFDDYWRHKSDEQVGAGGVGQGPG